MTDFKDEIRKRAQFVIHRQDGDEPPGFLLDMVRDGVFERDGIEVETMPLGDTGPWTTAGIPIVESAPSYGKQMGPVRMPVEDFRRLQTHIGVTLSPREDITEEIFWRVDDDRVESILAVLEGREEPNEFFDGIPRPYIEVGGDGSLRTTQEGRHRTVAAERAGFDTIPVSILYSPDREGAGGV